MGSRVVVFLLAVLAAGMIGWVTCDTGHEVAGAPSGGEARQAAPAASLSGAAGDAVDAGSSAPVRSAVDDTAPPPLGDADGTDEPPHDGEVYRVHVVDAETRAPTFSQVGRMLDLREELTFADGVPLDLLLDAWTDAALAVAVVVPTRART